jgi:hypothetical protein
MLLLLLLSGQAKFEGPFEGESAQRVIAPGAFEAVVAITMSAHDCVLCHAATCLRPGLLAPALSFWLEIFWLLSLSVPMRLLLERATV